MTRSSASVFLLSSLLFACTGSIDPAADPGPDAAPASADAGDPVSDPPPDGAPAPEIPTTTVVLIPGTLITGDYFDVMAERLAADGYRPVVFVPPDLFTESLAIGAARIGAFIDQVRATTGERRVHVVAECDGGVATRYYLQRLGGDRNVDQAITFVSAHHGTELSPIGEWVTDYQALDDITPGSPFLRDLDAAPYPAGLALTSIYTCWDELLWPQDTSRVDGARNVEFCDHYIGHFDGFWDDLVYHHIVTTLRGDGASLPVAY